MEEKSPKAAFKLENYRFTEFGFSEKIHEDYDGLSINIEPRGIYSKSEKRYTLILDFKASLDKGDNEKASEENVIKLVFVANFRLSEGVNEIPDFFYPNSIGISFPYIRAFLSTLTLQANIKLILLPLLNLSHLANPLRENTDTVD